MTWTVNPEAAGSNPVEPATKTSTYAAPRGPKGNLRLAQFLRDRYWPAVRQSVGPSWRETVERWRLPELVDDLGNHRLRDLSPEIIEVWFGQQLQRHAAGTANKNLIILRRALRKAIQWDYLTKDPTTGVKKAKEPPGRVKWFSPEKRAAIFEASGETLRLYSLFAYYTALRRGALLQLQKEWVDLQAGVIRVPITKNNHSQVVPVHPELRPLLEQLLSVGEPVGPLLPQVRPDTISRAFRRVVKKLGLGSYRFHDFRHDVASHLAMAGCNQKLIMEVLGHRDPRSSMRYTHLSTDAVRKAMEAHL